MIESINGNGGGDDEKAKVSANDTTAGFLNGKLVAGTNVTFTENNDGGNETLTIAAAGGVSGFTASDNTASPNNTVNAARLLVNSGSTNADAVVQPKGTGAFQLQLADGTATGGNKRGANAVDLQRLRGAAAQVASGSESAIIGGYNNTASGAHSLAFGYRNTASSIGAIAIGADTVANLPYMIAHSCSRFTADGDCQSQVVILRRQTTDATQTELVIADLFGNNTKIAITSDSTYTFSALITARRTDADNESAGYKIEGVIDRNAAANTTAFVGSPTVTILGEDTAAWDVVAEADTTNGALVFKVTGEAAKTIRWGATVTLMKITG
jgi:hypothetical protein